MKVKRNKKRLPLNLFETTFADSLIFLLISVEVILGFFNYPKADSGCAGVDPEDNHIKLEIRIPKYETNSKFEFPKFQMV